MHIILGATGHVGSSVARRLMNDGEKVLIVTRDEEKAAQWRAVGAEAAVVDVRDTKALTRLFRSGSSLFLLNPPASPNTDTVREEECTLRSILHALENSDLDQIVAESTYGAQKGFGIGDLGVLYEMEEYLRERGYRAHIIRAAYYMSNWSPFVASARDQGILFTLYPSEFLLPMVAPEDIGAVAATLLKSLSESSVKPGLHFIEGPRLYSSADVATAFSQVFARPVQAIAVPESEWVPYLKRSGFSEKAALSMAAMTKLTIEAGPQASTPIRGTTTLEAYLQSLVGSPIHQKPAVSLNHGELSL